MCFGAESMMRMGRGHIPRGDRAKRCSRRGAVGGKVVLGIYGLTI